MDTSTLNKQNLDTVIESKKSIQNKDAEIKTDKKVKEQKTKDASYTFSDISKIKQAYRDSVKASRGKSKGSKELLAIAKKLGYNATLSGDIVALNDDKGKWLLVLSSDKKDLSSERESNLTSLDSKTKDTKKVLAVGVGAVGIGHQLTADAVIKAIGDYSKTLDANEYRGHGGTISEANINSVMYNILETARRSEKKAEVKNCIKEVKAYLKKYPYGGAENVTSFSTIKRKLAEAEAKFSSM